MRENERQLPYLIARLDYDGRPHYSGATVEGVVEFQRAKFDDDGRFTNARGQRKRWYLDVSPSGYMPIIVARERLDDICALEELRWRAINHIENVLEPIYERAVARLRVAENPRLVRGDRIVRIVFRADTYGARGTTYPTEEEIKEPKDPGIVDRLGMIPTPDHEDFLAAANWRFHQDGIHSGLARVGRAEAALRKALDLYLAQRHPEIKRAHSIRRPQVVFVINGRYYPIGREEHGKNDVLWPQLADRVIVLNKLAEQNKLAEHATVADKPTEPVVSPHRGRKTRVRREQPHARDSRPRRP